MSPRVPSLLPETAIDGKWVIERLLGEGGMGAVYAARHARNGLAVAIKVLHADAARDVVVRQRFVHEGYAANRVGHPGTVQVIDDGVSADGTVYLVMERLSGKNLDEVARERYGGKMPYQVLVPHAVAWIEVVAAAHAVGIIHRDLKPENVMLCDDGRVKVLDFGLARVREISNKVRLTADSATMGTPAFMPPEQALGHWDRVDARADVYALGASLFTLLTDRLVHEGQTVQEMMVKVCTRPAPPIRSIAPMVPPDLAAIIDRALAFEPADRFPDGGAMLAQLRAFSASKRGPESGLSTLESAPTIDASKDSETQSSVTRVWSPGGHAPVARGPGGTLAAGQRMTPSTTPVSSGTRRRRRARGWGLGAAGAVALALTIVFVVRVREPRSGAAPEPQAPTVRVDVESRPVGTRAAPEDLHRPATSASAASSETPLAPPTSSPAVASATPSAPAASSPPVVRPAPKRLPPTPPKPCERDPLTRLCK